MEPYLDRRDAGRQLGARLAHSPGLAGAIVLGVARGGVIVADEVARALGVELEVLVVRKVGLPYQPEVAMGAVGEGGVRVVEEDVVAASGVSPSTFAQAEARERLELDRRLARYRRGAVAPRLSGRTVVIVDDGVATGCTMRAACQVVRSQSVARLVVAVPVISSDAARELRRVADEVVALVEVSGNFAVGECYRKFDQTSDEEVVACLDQAALRPRAASSTEQP